MVQHKPPAYYLKTTFTLKFVMYQACEGNNLMNNLSLIMTVPCHNHYWSNKTYKLSNLNQILVPDLPKIPVLNNNT